MIGFIGVKVAACAVLIAVAAASRAISKVHLGAASDPTMINVQWVSAIGDVLGNGTSTVQYGTSPRALSSTALGYNWTFTDPSTGTSRYLHAATLTGLTPGQQYFYRVGDPLDGWSPVFNFVATRTDFSTAAPLRVGLLGDMGWYNAQALSYIETEVANGDFDLVRAYVLACLLACLRATWSSPRATGSHTSSSLVSPTLQVIHVGDYACAYS